ncbi:MAG TPA: hypothetical protein VIW73_11020 [Candidatus Cybelea sp.]
MMQRALAPAVLLVAAATLGGCAGGSSGSPAGSLPPAPAARGVGPLVREAHSSRQLLFIAGLGNAVGYFSANIHEKNPPALGEITQGVTRATGLWVDRKGTLYVSNDTWPPSLAEYKRGSTTPSLIITNGLYTPGSVAVDASGNLYVADGQSGGVILVYPPRAGSPSRTIQIPSQRGGPGGLAFDAHGNLITATFDVEHQTGNVYSIAPGSSQPKNLNLLSVPGSAVGADKAGNIYIGGVAGDMAVYAPGSTSPSRWINAVGGGFYSDFAATSDGAIYWPNYNDGFIYEFAPGASGPTNTVQGGGVDAAVGTW